jgi:hypothetical protein
MDSMPFQTLQHPFEKKENPQTYVQTPFAYVHIQPARHILGLVGGNEVSVTKGNLVDLESDLRRLNLPLTACPSREYQPPPTIQNSIVRKSVKGSVEINVRQSHLPSMQMFPYTATFAPIPMKVTQCGRPEKY